MIQVARVQQQLAKQPELERRLREWGWAFGQRLPSEGEPEGETALFRASVDKSRVRYERRTGQGAGFRPTGVQRRALEASGVVAEWAGTDPIRCTETRTPGSVAPGGHFVPAPAQAVEDAVLALMRWDRRAGLALRACYCLLGRRPLSERIAWVASCSDTNVSRMGYRAALSRGRVAIAGALKISG